MKLRIWALFIGLYLASFAGIVIEVVPSAEALESFLRLFIDITIIVIGITSFAAASRTKKTLFIVFLLLSTISLLINTTNTLIQHVNGLREVGSIFLLFLFFDALFRSPWLPYFNGLFKKFAVIFLIIQLPVSFFQYVKAGYNAGDTVGGSLGAGNSGVLTFLIFTLIFYLIENRGSQRFFLEKLRQFLWLSVFLIPITFNETKISFIFIPLLLVSILNLRKLKHISIGLLTISILVLTFSKFYSNNGTTYEKPLQDIFNREYLYEYLAGDPERHEDVPRFSKLMLLPAVLEQERQGWLLGREYGAFKGGTTLDRSAFYIRNEWLLSGSIPYLFYVLVTGGVSLLLLMLCLLLGELLHKPYEAFGNYSSQLLFFLGCLFAITLVYNTPFSEPTFTIAFIYLLFFGKYFQHFPMFYEKKSLDTGE